MSAELAGRPPLEFSVATRLPSGGRTGTITTPHGNIDTPAFIAVGTKGTVKTLLPETVASLGVQAVLANAYHLYLQPGPDLVDSAGGLGAFMNWPGPTFTDSGGFQVMSLGSGYKKIIAMTTAASANSPRAPGLAKIDDDGVTFTSHLDGSTHRFTPEKSMEIQHQLGADIIFAFDECTTLADDYDYTAASLARTTRWAERSLRAHERLTAERADKPFQALFGVVQGGIYEDLRRQACQQLLAVAGSAGFPGYGIGGALEKERLAEIVGWVSQELPENRPRHLLGISEPDDLFAAIAAGADTFDCVSPTRVARNAAVYSRDGRFNVNVSSNRRAEIPIDDACDCYTCLNYSRAYLHHLFKAKEMLAFTLASVHNLRFTVRLVDNIRQSIESGTFEAYRSEFCGRYYVGR